MKYEIARKSTTPLMSSHSAKAEAAKRASISGDVNVLRAGGIITRGASKAEIHVSSKLQQAEEAEQMSNLCPKKHV